MKKTIDSIDKSTDFSLVLGGPLYQLFRRAHLTGGALELLRQRILCDLAASPGCRSCCSPLWKDRRWAAVSLYPSSGRGSSYQVFSGSAALDPCRTRGSSAHAFCREAIPGTQFDRRERFATVWWSHYVGISGAQLGGRRGAADRIRLCRRDPDYLAPLHSACRSHVVRSAEQRGVETLAQRNVVQLFEPPALPVPAAALVFSDLHLDALSLAGVTHSR